MIYKRKRGGAWEKRKRKERRWEEKRKREIYIVTCQHMNWEDLYNHCMQRWLHSPLLIHCSGSTSTRSIKMKHRMSLGSLGCLYKTHSFAEKKKKKKKLVRGDTKLREKLVEGSWKCCLAACETLKKKNVARW